MKAAAAAELDKVGRGVKKPLFFIKKVNIIKTM
jgi:hypothetical protein